MKRDWIRLYTNLPNDPKVQRLTAPMFKFWINCICLAGQFDGIIPSEDDLVFLLQLDRRQVVKWTEDLRNRGVFDLEEGRLKPHNWAGRQYISDVSTQRVVKFRVKQRNVSCNASETPSEADTETDTDTEQNKTPKPLSSVKKSARTKSVFRTDAQAFAFADFWGAYWLKAGKAAAEKAYVKTNPTPKLQAMMLGAIARQTPGMLSREPDKRPHAATWLNGRRWEDEVTEPLALVPRRNAINDMIDRAAERLGV